jgi:hypothetical protein
LATARKRAGCSPLSTAFRSRSIDVQTATPLFYRTNCQLLGRVRVVRSALLATAKRNEKSHPDIAVKPFGNSQKGIEEGWLTWFIPSDKYPAIK